MELRAGYKKTEAGLIPDDWLVGEFGQLIKKISSGKSSTDSQIGDFPIYGSTGIIGWKNYFDYSGEKILVARVGANAGTVNRVSGNYCVSDNTLMISYGNGFDISFSYFQLISFKLNTIVFGSGQPLITGGQLKQLVLAYPPTLEEQTAIANALSDADALIGSLQKLIAKKRQIKQGAMQTLLNPYENGKLKSGWTIQKFDEIFKKYPSKNFQIQTNEYLESGSYPIVDQGKQLIAGYTNNPSKLFIIQNDGLIIFGDHTREFKYIDFDFVVGADGVQILGTSNNHSSRFFFYLFLTREVPNTGYNRHFKFLKEMIFFFPEQKDEQIKIAHVLSDMDAEIVALETKLAKYQQIKQGMMQNLLTGRIRLV